MKTLCALLALFALTSGVVGAQDAAIAAAAPMAVRRSPEELEKLLAPIALYPDALIAIILPAATASTDVVLAARQLRDNPNDISQIEHRAWDESVKSLANYPAVLAWMDENLAWTKQVGEAFAEQPADVMQAMQRLRAQARAAGTLVDTPQQQVIAEPDVIRIVPAQPNVIYVPYYEPDVVFVSRPYYGYTYPRPFFSFGVGVAVGSWLAFECDWHRHTIWIGNRHRPWAGHDWRRPLFVAPPIGAAYVRTTEVRTWRPPAQVFRGTAGPSPRIAPVVVQPTPFAQIEKRPGNVARPAVITSHQGERNPLPGSRRPVSEVSKDPTTAATIVRTPALAPTVPTPAESPTTDRPRENRGRNQPSPRNAPSTVVQAPASAPAASPTPAPTVAPDRSRDYTRRSHAPAVAQTQSVATTPAPAPTSIPDHRSQSRSVPAAAPTPPPSAPATTTPAAPPSNPPAHRGGRNGGSQNNGSSS